MHSILTVVVLPIASFLHLWEKLFVHVRGQNGGQISRGPTHDLQ